MLHYVSLPAIVAFVGGIIVAVIGFSPVGIDYQLLDSYAYSSLPDFTPVYPLYLIIYSIVMPPVVSVIVNTLVINKRLSQTALSLIRNRSLQQSKDKGQEFYPQISDTPNAS